MASRSSATCLGAFEHVPLGVTAGGGVACFMSTPMWYMTVASGSLSTWPVRMQTTVSSGEMIFSSSSRWAPATDAALAGSQPKPYLPTSALCSRITSSLTSRTRVVRLTSDTRIVNSRFFGNDPNKVPETALSVGVGTVMDADEVLIIINGPNKARALRHVVEEGVNHMWTVSALQMHPQGIIVCDDEATLELKVGTVRYFKDMETRNLDPATLLK